MKNKIIDLEEIIFHDEKNSTTGATALKLSFLSKYNWKLEEVNISDLLYVDVDNVWTPDQNLSTEGLFKSDESYSHEKYIILNKEKKVSNEDQKYLDKWADEYYARQYATLSTNCPAIVVVKDFGRYKIKSGRHRSRASFLKGNKTILAYVGTLIENQ